MGEVMAKLEAVEELLENHVKKQDMWNSVVERRLQIAEQWIQTTTGKFVVITAVFGIVGSVCYVVVTWILNHFFK